SSSGAGPPYRRDARSDTPTRARPSEEASPTPTEGACRCDSSHGLGAVRYNDGQRSVGLGDRSFPESGGDIRVIATGV
ncbi:MAG: hypothetical protein WAN87_09705, partial [Thermoplasmata archaeon]